MAESRERMSVEIRRRLGEHDNPDIAMTRKCPDCNQTILNSQDCPLCYITSLEEQRDELRAEVARLVLLLDEWLKTPFFKTREEWATWVADFRPRVEAAIRERGLR